jgi:hypothetical protein
MNTIYLGIIFWPWLPKCLFYWSKIKKHDHLYVIHSSFGARAVQRKDSSSIICGGLNRFVFFNLRRKLFFILVRRFVKSASVYFDLTLLFYLKTGVCFPIDKFSLYSFLSCSASLFWKYFYIEGKTSQKEGIVLRHLTDGF